jgi:hypothetical protein
MKIRIFYSWQSDKLSKVNKDFIQSATKQAIKRLKRDVDLSIDPALDRDTKNLPGAPAIAQSILEKIEKSDLFLCDVTLVTPKRSTRPSPNPNVLIELGYAAAKLGWERIICIMNKGYGDPEKLPFDLQHRRWPILYSLSDNVSKEEAKRECQKLSESIEHAIRVAKESGILIKTVNPKDRRAAKRFQEAIFRFDLIFSAFVFEFAEDKMRQEISGYFRPGSNLQVCNYLSKINIETILLLFASSDIGKKSNLSVNQMPLNWLEAFIRSLKETMDLNDRILSQYADRDEELIELVEELYSCSRSLKMLLESWRNYPINFSHQNRMPDVYMPRFRHLLFVILKSTQVTNNLMGI